MLILIGVSAFFIIFAKRAAIIRAFDVIFVFEPFYNAFFSVIAAAAAVADRVKTGDPAFDRFANSVKLRFCSNIVWFARHAIDQLVYNKPFNF